LIEIMTPPPTNPTHPANDDKAVVTRRVDLGREDELVTWAEWFQRSSEALDAFILSQQQAHQKVLAERASGDASGDGDGESGDGNANDAGVDDSGSGNGSGVPSGLTKVFRVTLADGRPFAITAVHTHMNRGRCFVGTDRWGEVDKVCDVISGYTMIGAGPDHRPTAISVPPSMIASVECVLVPPRGQGRALEQPSDDGEQEAFGFARFAQMRDRPEVSEVEDG
jgi:hypothetical protein